ncbi:protein EVI2B [Fundulus heteroclitus]|uniref:protein EVI2B n=1 Tax=Fundulus heteroclitus TaxID=8078 RepID=UPI00165CDEB9|nr:protein EVI2B [Fundulus heteroclitus]
MRETLKVCKRRRTEVKMTSFILIMLLPLAAISTLTSEQPHNFMDATAGEVVQNIQLATQQLSTIDQLLVALNITSTNTADRNTPDESRSSTPSLYTTKTMLPATLSINPQTASTVTPSSGILTVKSKVWKSITMVMTSQTSKQRKKSTQPVMLVLGTIKQSHGTLRTSTSQLKLNEMTTSFKSTSKSTAIYTETTSFKPEENISTRTKPVPSGDGAQSSTPVTPTLTFNKTKKKYFQHSNVVAAIIGAALLLMIVGFVLICMRRQRLQKQQTTTNWAGPSPFLEGETNNGNVVLRSSNQISLTSFLPHRLSKRFSLHPETNEMKDITPRATLEENHQGSTFGQAMDGNDAHKKSSQQLFHI